MVVRLKVFVGNGLGWVLSGVELTWIGVRQSLLTYRLG